MSIGLYKALDVATTRVDDVLPSPHSHPRDPEQPAESRFGRQPAKLGESIALMVSRRATAPDRGTHRHFFLFRPPSLGFSVLEQSYFSLRDG